MCCVFTILLFFGPRLAILVWWLINRVYVSLAFNNNWLLGLLGFIFLPWMTLMYIIIYPGGITGFDWIWLGLGLLADVASYAGGGYGNRDRLGR
ncbi:hypothetical protein ACFLWA_00190 [Chloroflexota bacterium]